MSFNYAPDAEVIAYRRLRAGHNHPESINLTYVDHATVIVTTVVV